MPLQFITPGKPVSCPKLRRDFECGTIRKAELTITGLGLYRAFLNGQRIGNEYLTPYCNNYDAWVQALTFDVTEQITAGDNACRVVISKYP